MTPPLVLSLALASTSTLSAESTDLYRLGLRAVGVAETYRDQLELADSALWETRAQRDRWRREAEDLRLDLIERPPILPVPVEVPDRTAAWWAVGGAALGGAAGALGGYEVAERAGGPGRVGAALGAGLGAAGGAALAVLLHQLLFEAIGETKTATITARPIPATTFDAAKHWRE